jgi:hypothetical protein
VNGDQRLPLHAQKCVLGRALVYQVLDQHHIDVADAGYNRFWEQARGRLCDLTAQELEHPSADSLKLYLGELGRQIRKVLLFPDSNAERACMPLLEEIDRVLAAAGQAQEDLLLTAVANALQAAAGLYGKHGIDVPPDLVKRVTVKLDFQLLPVVTNLPIQLQAVTTLADSADGAAAVVDVLICPEELDELTVFSLPYVLLHECVCHVLQGPWSGRVQADASDRFAEGWMDVAAFVGHETMAGSWRTEVPGPDLLAAPRPTAQFDAAEKVHRARHQPQDHDRAWAPRAMGTEAARGLLKLLDRLPECGSDATSAFLRLSLQLNASTFTNEERALFVLYVHRALRMKVEHKLVPHLRNYLTNGELDPLVRRTLSLFS